jgi:toxin ParE1/3/4
MARIVWTERALDDLENLLEYIARDAPITACRFAQQMLTRVEMLQDHPMLGGLVPEDETHTYREILQGSYRVIYRIKENTIYLVTIHHAARLLDFDDAD